MKRLLTVLAIAVLGLWIQSCEIVVDPPETGFFVAKTWRLVKVRNGQINECVQGLEKYRLILNDSTNRFVEISKELENCSPNLNDVRIPIDSGAWQLNSTGSEIILNREIAGKQERWTIIELELRKMRLERVLEADKVGSYSLTYFLEAVPQ